MSASDSSVAGGSYVNRNLAALAADGRLVQIGPMGGETASVDLPRLLGRRLTITESTLRPRSVEEKGRSPPRSPAKSGRPSNRASSSQGVAKHSALSERAHGKEGVLQFSSVTDSPVAPARPYFRVPATVNGQQRTDPDSGPRPDVGIHWE